MINDAHDAIRRARAAINEAIARHDADAIAAFLLPSYHVITARSLHRSGKDESVRGWKEMFKHDRTVTHAGVAHEIHVNEEWGMAQEHGQWTGTLTAKNGPIEIIGDYAAKWHLTSEGWLLQAEIFTPITIKAR
ncbi:MAG TPA: nuclear transport factor 2 family protein [Thermoanaerobaculia bacterium]|jgi:ketosteroid isomerase-like protein|nr:nuclear transport factor 2 family protein [Thermoanaerobaculia bacterium]